MSDHKLYKRINLGEIEAVSIIDDGDEGVFLLLQSNSSPGFSMSGTFPVEHAESLVALIQAGIAAVKEGAKPTAEPTVEPAPVPGVNVPY